jgi:hypothetical protein
MDKSTFEKYSSYQPKERNLLAIPFIVFIACLVPAVILSSKYFPILQQYVYSNNDDLLFSIYSTRIFVSSVIIISSIINFMILEKLFSIIPIMKKIIIWSKIEVSKIFDYDEYIKTSKRRKIFILVVFLIASFLIVMSFFTYLRINDTGIYYNRMFEFTGKHYKWDELKSVSVYPTIYYRKSDHIYPKMEITFGENTIDIWKGAGLSSPNSETLIKVIEIIKKNTKNKIKVNSNFTKEMQELMKKCTDEKRNNIKNVFNYLKEQ